MNPYGLKHVYRVTAKDKEYFYYRNGAKSIRIRLPDPRQVDQDTFVKSWLDATRQTAQTVKAAKAKRYTIRLHAALKRYLHFKKQALSAKSSKQYATYANRLKRQFGDVRVSSITEDKFRAFFDSIDGTVSSNELLGFTKRFYKWAQKSKLVLESPVTEIDPREYKSDGYPRWTEAEILYFKQCYPLGTWEFLVIDVLLNIGCRISDALALGPQHLSANVLCYVSKKSGVEVNLALTDAFLKRIDHVTQHKKPFLYDPRYGKGFRNYDTFNHLFKPACAAIGIEKTCHGLRKSVATRYANKGFSANQIMAKMGWKRLQSAEIYVKEADRKMLGISDTYDFDDD